MGSNEQEDNQEQRCDVPWRLGDYSYQGKSASSSVGVPVNLDPISPLIENANHGKDAQENGDYIAKMQSYPTDHSVEPVDGAEQSYPTDGG